MITDGMLAIDDAARQTGQPVRRLRQWCATGRVRCERDGRGWLIPEVEIGRIMSIAAARTVQGSNRHASALVVPRSSSLRSSSLREQVAGELRITAQTVSMGTLTIDGQPYLIATWPKAAEARGSYLATLAERLDGELLE